MSLIDRIKQILGFKAKPDKESKAADEGASKKEVEKVAEEKAKPRIGYIHLSELLEMLYR